MEKIIFFPIIIFLGLITTYEDIKFGKIKNKWILYAILYGVIAYLLIYWLNILHNNPQIVDYLKKIFINSIVAIIVGYILWQYKIWTSADAKLFIAFVVIIPLDYYSKSYLPYFPSFALLINIFLPAFIFIIIRATFSTYTFNVLSISSLNKKIIEVIGKIKKEWLNYLGIILGYCAIFLFFRILREKLRNLLPVIFGGNQLLLFVFLFFIFRPLSRIFRKKIVTYLITFLFFAYIIINWLFFHKIVILDIAYTLKISLFFIIFVFMIRKFLDFHMEKYEVIKIKVKNLVPNTVLTEDAVKKIKEHIKDIETIYTEGLTEEQVKSIKNSLSEDCRIDIYKTMPFAPIIFSGVLITFITKQSLLHILLVFFRSI